MGAGWQTWETAPRDGEPLLATNNTVAGGFPQVVMFDEERLSAGYPWAVGDAEIYYPEGAFTHWRRDCLDPPESSGRNLADANTKKDTP